MKTLSFKSMAGCLAVVLLASCSSGSDDPVPAPQPLTPDTPNWLGGDVVRQVKYSGAFASVWHWELNYDAGRLTEATSWELKNRLTTRDDADAAHYSLSYTPDGINVYSSGKAVEVGLTMSGKLLSSAHSGNTTYSYSYSADGRLMSWEVIYQNTGFNAKSTKGAAGSITWDSDGNIAEIVYTPTMDAPTKKYTYTYTYSEAFNVNGLLPELSSRAFGCEGSEYLYYAGLLGKSTRHLPAQLTIVYSETPDEKDTYSFRYYPTNGKDVTNCEYGEEGKVVIVEYNY